MFKFQKNIFLSGGLFQDLFRPCRPWLIKGLRLFSIGIILALAFNMTMEFIIHHKGEVVTPDIKGKTLRESIDILNGKGLFLRIVGNQHDETVPPDSVLFQNPLPGSVVRKGKPISITLSVGGELVYVPDMVNLTLAEGEILLKRNSLVLGETAKVYSQDVKKGRALSQDPEPGEVVTKGSIVNLVLSNGPATILGTLLMPDVVGKNISEAKNIFYETGLNINKIERVVNNRVPEGTILRQSPSPGEIIENDTELILFASEKKEIEELSHRETLYFEVPQGYFPRTLKIVLQDVRGKTVISEEKEEPGTKVLKEFDIFGKGKVFLYLDETLVEVKNYD